MVRPYIAAFLGDRDDLPVAFSISTRRIPISSMGTPVDAATLRGYARIHGFSLPAGPDTKVRQANPL